MYSSEAQPILRSHKTNIFFSLIFRCSPRHAVVNWQLIGPHYSTLPNAAIDISGYCLLAISQGGPPPPLLEIIIFEMLI